MYRNIALLLCVFLFACSPSADQVGNEQPAATDLNQSEDKPTKPQADTPDAESESEDFVPRSIDAQKRMGSFDFASQFPVLNAIVSNRPELHREVISYAQSMTTGNGLKTIYDVEQALTMRANLIERMNPLIEAWDQRTENLDQLKALNNELNTIGMRVATSEGMFTTLVESALPDFVINMCPADMQAQLAFNTAAAATIGGEYPYGNMAPFGEAVWAGEQLMQNHPESPYAKQSKARFQELVGLFLGQYLRREGDYSTPAVGHPSDGLHEFSYSETESHKLFLENHPQSKYAQAVQSMLDETSTSDAKPEELYIVYDKYFEDESEAKNYQHEALWNGKDLLHVLPVLLGNGKKNYLVSYRFYDDSESATAFFLEKEKTNPDIKMMFTSLTKDGFVQSGI